MKTLTTILLLTIFATGCAFSPQQVELNPQITVRNDNIGKGDAIYLSVIDERASQSLGRRGTAYGAAAEITATKPLADIVKMKLSEGLQARGFTASDDNSLDKKLQIEIRQLEYSTSTGFWTGGVHIKGALKGEADNGQLDYENMYRYEKEERVMVVPTSETNAEWINIALSETLNELLKDDRLFQFLAGPAE